MLGRVLFASVLFAALAVGNGAAAQDEAKLLALGITDHAAAPEELQSGAALPAPRFNSPAVAHVLATGLKKGDTVEVRLKKNGTALMHNTTTLDADQETVLVQAGKQGVPAGGWPQGEYTAEVEIKRDGKPIVTESSDPMVFE